MMDATWEPSLNKVKGHLQRSKVFVHSINLFKSFVPQRPSAGQFLQPLALRGKCLSLVREFVPPDLRNLAEANLSWITNVTIGL